MCSGVFQTLKALRESCPDSTEPRLMTISPRASMWMGLEFAHRAHVTSIDAERVHPNLSSAIRLFVLGFYRMEIEATHATTAA